MAGAGAQMLWVSPCTERAAAGGSTLRWAGGGDDGLPATQDLPRERFQKFLGFLWP